MFESFFVFTFVTKMIKHPKFVVEQLVSLDEQLNVKPPNIEVEQ